MKLIVNEASDPISKIQSLISQANEAYHSACEEQGDRDWPLMDKEGNIYGLSSDIRLDGRGYIIIPINGSPYSDYRPSKIRVLKKVGGKTVILQGDYWEEGWKDAAKILKQIIKDSQIGTSYFKEFDPNWEMSDTKDELMANKASLKDMNKRIGRRANTGMEYISENQIYKNKNMSHTIRLKESEFKRMISESVKRVLNEMTDGEYLGDDNHGQEEIAQGEELIKQHNQGLNMDGSYYIIGVTGQLQKYYTLYYFSKPIADFGRHNPFLYKGNLSQSFLSAVKKMIAKAPNVYIDVEPENAILSKIQKYKSEVFHSGKYQGLSYNEVYEKDPQYLVWIFNKLKEESKQMKKNPYTGQRYYLTKKQAEMYEILEPLIKTYHEEQIKSRRENVESEHITSDQTRGIDFTITNTPQRKHGQYGTYITVRGRNGNRYYIMNMNDMPNLNDEEISALKGKTISIQSASTQPTEIYGVKYNKLSRVKGLEIH